MRVSISRRPASPRTARLLPSRMTRRSTGSSDITSVTITIIMREDGRCPERQRCAALAAHQQCGFTGGVLTLTERPVGPGVCETAIKQVIFSSTSENPEHLRVHHLGDGDRRGQRDQQSLAGRHRGCDRRQRRASAKCQHRHSRERGRRHHDPQCPARLQRSRATHAQITYTVTSYSTANGTLSQCSCAWRRRHVHAGRHRRQSAHLHTQRQRDSQRFVRLLGERRHRTGDHRTDLRHHGDAAKRPAGARRRHRHRGE